MGSKEQQFKMIGSDEPKQLAGVDAPKGVTRMSEPTVAELQQQLKDSMEALEKANSGQLSKEDRDRLTFLEGDNKKMIEARDKAKRERDAAEDKRLAEQGEFQTLAEQKTAEALTLSEQLASRDTRLAEYDARDQAELDGLLPLIDESLREDVKALPLEAAMKLARKLVGTKGKPPGFKPPGEGGDKSITRQAFDALPPAAQNKHISDGGLVKD